MERPPSPDPPHDRFVHAEERVNAAIARVSEAQERVTIAKDRLARVRLALTAAHTEGETDPAVDGDSRSPDTSRSSDARGKDPW
jgi:hypothetical protein